MECQFLLSSCEFQSNSFSINSTFSIKESLKNEIKFEVPSYSFSASNDYQNLKEVIEKRDMIITSSMSKCTYYEVKSITYFPMNVSDNFIEGFRSLNSEDDYFHFIEVFGTHYLSEVIMGAKSGFTSYIEKSRLNEFNKFSIQTGASLSLALARGSIQNNIDKEIAQRFNQIRTDYYEFTLGAYPVNNGNIQEWIEKMKENPYPINYKIQPIENLFSKKYLKNFNEDEIERKKDKLIITLQRYCNHIEKCAFPLPNYIQTNIYLSTSRNTKSTTVPCNGNDRVLSCGITTKGNYNNFPKDNVCHFNGFGFIEGTSLCAKNLNYDQIKMVEGYTKAECRKFFKF